MLDDEQLPTSNVIEGPKRSEQSLAFAFLAWSGGFQCVLIFASWSLWFPDVAKQGSDAWQGGSFPGVPAFAAMATVTWSNWVLAPLWLGATLVQTVVAGRLTIEVNRSDSQTSGKNEKLQLLLNGSLVLAIVTWVALVGLNQHRLQAWAYLAAWVNLLYLLGIRCGTNDADQSTAIRKRWCWMIVSVYFFSAISKFDHTFFVTLGSQFLTTLRNSGTGAHLPLETVWPWWATLMFPLGELIVAIGLASDKTRRGMVFVAMFLHGLLLWILGPLGMQHQPGVLLWNVFFIGQLWLLFWPVTTPESNRPTSESWMARLALYFVVLLPLAQPWGWCDSWPAWELYAPRGSRIQVFLADPAIEQLPELAPYVSQDTSPEFGPLWRELRLDQWSLDQRGAPIYPQDRFQLGVAIAVRERVIESEQVLIRWLGPANRWTGAREQKLLNSQTEIEAFGGRFFWNYQPPGFGPYLK